MCCCPILEKCGLSKKNHADNFYFLSIASGWESKLSAESIGAKDRTLVSDELSLSSSWQCGKNSFELSDCNSDYSTILMLDWLRNVGNVGKCWIPSTRRTGLPAGRQKWHNQDSGMSNLKMPVIVIIIVDIIATVIIVVIFIFIVITIKRKATRTWEGLVFTMCQRWGKGKGRRRFLVKSNNCIMFRIGAKNGRMSCTCFLLWLGDPGWLKEEWPTRSKWVSSMTDMLLKMSEMSRFCPNTAPRASYICRCLKLLTCFSL